MSARSKVSIAVVVVVAFLTGVFFTTIGANFFDRGGSILSESFAGDTKINTNQSLADFQDAFTQVAESVNPTVVQIRSERVAESAPSRENPFEGTPFEDFFGGPRGQQSPRRSQGLGSGVIVRSNGYIVTNNHVVQDADELSVTMYDGSGYDAEVVGTDPRSDLAVIRVDANDLPAVSYGNSDNVRTGQWVLAFGSPLSPDLENTVTAGIVSAKGRVSESTASINTYAELIQTDAAINPGNSGGPLLNLQGELVGINSAIISPSRMNPGNVGIGFAIPVNLVKNVTEQLIETGSVARGYLGVGFDEVSESLASALDVPRGAAQITEVQPGTPAAEAGLQQGEVIVAINGNQLHNYRQLLTTIGGKQPGDQIEMTVVNQNGDERTVNVELASQPDDLFAQSGPSDSGEGDDSESGAANLEDLGLSLRDVTPSFLQERGVENAERYQGVQIADIDQGSNAYREAELRAGDIVTHINRQRVRNRQEFMQAYSDVEAGQNFLVRAVRLPDPRAQGAQPRSFLTALVKP